MARALERFMAAIMRWLGRVGLIAVDQVEAAAAIFQVAFRWIVISPIVWMIGACIGSKWVIGISTMISLPAAVAVYAIGSLGNDVAATITNKWPAEKVGSFLRSLGVWYAIIAFCELVSIPPPRDAALLNASVQLTTFAPVGPR